MIRHYWTILVNESHIDRDSNNLVLGKSIEQIQFRLPISVKEQFLSDIDSKGFVLLPFQMHVVSFLERTENEKNVDLLVQIETPNGHIFNFPQSTIEFKDKNRNRHRLKTDTVPVSGTGENILRVFFTEHGKRSLQYEFPLLINIKFE